MRSRNMTYLVFGAVVSIGAYYGWKFTARGAYESAEYTVVERDGDIEIRDYPELTLAETSTQFDAQGEDGSFMRLFHFISGRNNADQKIAMTVPVFMGRESAGRTGRMGFVMPKTVADTEVPVPASDAVKIRKRKPGRFAVIQFTGQMNDNTARENETALRDWLEVSGRTHAQEAEYAGYDPPWTPGPFRRNEVLIRLDGEL